MQRFFWLVLCCTWSTTLNAQMYTFDPENPPTFPFQLNLTLSTDVTNTDSDILLRIQSEQFSVRVDWRPVTSISIRDSLIYVRTDFEVPVEGTFVVPPIGPPGWKPIPAPPMPYQLLDFMTPIGALPTGNYDLHFEIFNEPGNQPFGTGSVSFSVVPEPDARMLAGVAFAAMVCVALKRM